MLDLGYHNQWRNSECAVDLRRRPLHHPNLERLICAAVSSARFGALLVGAPAQALAQFQVGRCLTTVERRLVLAISDAADVAEFAGRLHASVIEMHSTETGATAAELNNIKARKRYSTSSRLRTVHGRAPQIAANATRAR